MAWWGFGWRWRSRASAFGCEPSVIQVQDLLALGAATCWAASALLSAEPSKHLGAFAFVRWRMMAVLLLLWPAAWLLSDFSRASISAIAVMALSGVIGISLGDSALFGAMNRLGPRRTGVLFATHALFSAGLGFVLLSERLGLQAYVGALVTVGGVMVAVAWGRRSSEVHAWEPEGNSRSGVGLALLAAFCQAVGALIAKPVLSGEVAMDPVLALALRVSAAWLALWLGWALRPSVGAAKQAINWTVFKQTAICGWVGMGVGMGLLLWALSLGAVGAVGVLSSISPVMVLPLLWWKFKRVPAIGAWVGAALAVFGTALMLTR